MNFWASIFVPSFADQSQIWHERLNLRYAMLKFCICRRSDVNWSGPNFACDNKHARFQLDQCSLLPQRDQEKTANLIQCWKLCVSDQTHLYQPQLNLLYERVPEVCVLGGVLLSLIYDFISWYGAPIFTRFSSLSQNWRNRPTNEDSSSWHSNTEWNIAMSISKIYMTMIFLHCVKIW